MANNFKIEEVRDFWDSVAEIYNETNQKIGEVHYQRFVEGLKFLALKDGDRVLNLWSRTGNAIPYLEKAAKIDLYNLEVSPKMLIIAQARFPQNRFQTTDLEHLEFGDNFFDVILSLETLEHAPDSERLLQEFFRVLKPGGRLVMSLPPKTAEWPLRIYNFFFKNHGEGPHRFLSSKTVKKLLKEAGFTLILHRGTLLIPLGPKWLQRLGEKLITWFQKTPLRELGIRQFYVCQKPL